jgi:hypothetical protein
VLSLGDKSRNRGQHGNKIDHEQEHEHDYEVGRFAFFGSGDVAAGTLPLLREGAGFTLPFRHDRFGS